MEYWKINPKHEIRSTKSETNPNDPNQMTETMSRWISLLQIGAFAF
jgi:hypothetical protein